MRRLPVLLLGGLFVTLAAGCGVEQKAYVVDDAGGSHLETFRTWPRFGHDPPQRPIEEDPSQVDRGSAEGGKRAVSTEKTAR